MYDLLVYSNGSRVEYIFLTLKKYKGVNLNIGMFQVSLAENDVKFDFDSGAVDFWDFARALRKNIDSNIADGNHSVYHREGLPINQTLNNYFLVLYAAYYMQHLICRILVEKNNCPKVDICYDRHIF